MNWKSIFGGVLGSLLTAAILFVVGSAYGWFTKAIQRDLPPGAIVLFDTNDNSCPKDGSWRLVDAGQGHYLRASGNANRGGGVGGESEFKIATANLPPLQTTFYYRTDKGSFGNVGQSDDGVRGIMPEQTIHYSNKVTLTGGGTSASIPLNPLFLSVTLCRKGA
jgi:hypothetical protein